MFYYLIWVLEKKIFSLRKFQTGVNDDSQDTPSIVHVKCDLLRKQFRFELLRTENNVSRRITRWYTGYVTKNNHKKIVFLKLNVQINHYRVYGRIFFT